MSRPCASKCDHALTVLALLSARVHSGSLSQCSLCEFSARFQPARSWQQTAAGAECTTNVWQFQDVHEKWENCLNCQVQTLQLRLLHKRNYYRVFSWQDICKVQRSARVRFAETHEVPSARHSPIFDVFRENVENSTFRHYDLLQILEL